MRSVTLLQKMSSRVKSNDLLDQGIGPALPTQHLCSRFKSSFSPKNHHTRDIQLLIPHKQNPLPDMNQLAVTAKILLQSSIQLCVSSVAVQSWQTDFHGLHETSLACSTFRPHMNTDHNCDMPEIRKITLWYSEPVTQPANV
jgi:hypothetical protein